MKPSRYLSEEELVRKASDILYEKLGAVEASRFLTMARKRREESVKRHRQWQETLEKEAFFDEVFTSTD